MAGTPWLWQPPEILSLPVSGSRMRAPVRRIFCVGRNYQAHALEMGDSIDKRSMQPFYFLKDASSLVLSGAEVPYPPATADYQHELELVVVLGSPGFRVTGFAAEALVAGYAVGLDMTRRDLQSRAKELRRPWDLGKNVEQSAVCSAMVPADRVNAGRIPCAGAVTLRVNGQTRQRSDLSCMIWSIPELIADLSRYYHLAPGDLIYTGTPEGVGPVQPGDRLDGEIEGVGTVVLTLVEPEAESA